MVCLRCVVHGEDLIKMSIPNNCVREQYFGFLRDYYQKYSSIDLHYLNVMLTDMAYDGRWKPFFESVAQAYRENSAVRDAREGEPEPARFSESLPCSLPPIIWMSRNWK